MTDGRVRPEVDPPDALYEASTLQACHEWVERRAN